MVSEIRIGNTLATMQTKWELQIAFLSLSNVIFEYLFSWGILAVNAWIVFKFQLRDQTCTIKRIFIHLSQNFNSQFQRAIIICRCIAERRKRHNYTLCCFVYWNSGIKYLLKNSDVKFHTSSEVHSIVYNLYYFPHSS